MQSQPLILQTAGKSQPLGDIGSGQGVIYMDISIRNMSQTVFEEVDMCQIPSFPVELVIYLHLLGKTSCISSH